MLKAQQPHSSRPIMHQRQQTPDPAGRRHWLAQLYRTSIAGTTFSVLPWYYAHAAPPTASTATESVAWPPPQTSAQAQQIVRWVQATQDAHQRAFFVLDKPMARLHVFDEHGSWRGTAPVLIGYALGDRTAAGIGKKKLSQIAPKDRTTPAGRFITEPGVNLHGHDIVWVDYDAAISLHRVRSVSADERRLERLSSGNAHDHRITYGCINVSAAFYNRAVAPYFGQYAGVAYVLPDTEPFARFFEAATHF